MIEEKEDGSSNGMLIDWEFAVRILSGDRYRLSGTVSVVSIRAIEFGHHN
jgi:hypothetical protein